MHRSPRIELRRLSRPFSVELLEPRSLMAVDVFLDFGAASGSNSFAARLAELTNLQGRIPLTSAEVATLKTSIEAAAEKAFSAFDVTFSHSPPSGPYETISFGRAKSFVPSAPEVFGQADLDWLNGNQSTPSGKATAYVFPAEFHVPELSGLSQSAYLTRLGNGLTFWGMHELGHAFGLENQDAFVDPSITADNYASTLGVQNRNYMTVPEFGLSFTQFDSLSGFSFSPFSRAKLQMAAGLTAAPIATVGESPTPHDAAASAQALSLVSYSHAAAKGIDVHAATVSSGADLYQFEAQVGDLISLSTLATDIYEHVASSATPFSFDTVIRLMGADGSTVLATSDDVMAGVNKIGPTASTRFDQDSLIVNYRAVAAGTCYVEVTSKTGTSGSYDLLVTKWTPALHPWQNPVGDSRDVTRDGLIVARDALRIINEINRVGGGRRLPSSPVGAENPAVIVNGEADYFYFDTNGDEFVSAVDALRVINYLNAPSGSSPSSGEGEGDTFLSSPGDSLSPTSVDQVLAAAWWISDDLAGAAHGRRK